MDPLLRNIVSVIAGWIGGSIVNTSLVNTGNRLYPIPGVDLSDIQALAEVMPTLEPKYFLFPFLAHALGTLTGAIIAGLLAANRKMVWSLLVGVLFFVGGIMVNYILTGPLWFTVTDLLFAYIPMAWIGGKIALSLSGIKN